MKADIAGDIVRMLRDRGYEAYFVGGCVRDMVMGIEPSDYDIATSATPEEVIDIFPRTEPIGAKFGVVLVIREGHPYEVATFRSDREYLDGRRPSGVVFTDAEQDVLRRDFTINGLLYDPQEDRVIDFVEGRRDIEAKIVRSIGDPRRRFGEDKLRLLRAVRFGARLGYTIDGETWAAVRGMASEIGQVSQERIREELVRILTEGQAGRGVRLLEESGLARMILPGWTWAPHVEQMLAMLPRRVPADFATAVLLHECPLEVADEIVRRLRYPKREAAHVHALSRDQHRFADVGSMSVPALKRFLRSPRFADHLELHRLRAVATRSDLETVRFVRGRLEAWPPDVLAPEALISGRDLIMMGLRPGPFFSHILTAIEDAQLEGRLTDRESALAFVRARFV